MAMMRLHALPVVLACLGHVAALALELRPAASPDQALIRERHQEDRTAVAGFHKRHRSHGQAAIHMTPAMEAEAENKREAEEKVQKADKIFAEKVHALKANEKARAEFSEHLKKSEEEMHAALADNGRPSEPADPQDKLREALEEQRDKEIGESNATKIIKRVPTRASQAQAEEVAREAAERDQSGKLTLRAKEAEQKRRSAPGGAAFEAAEALSSQREVEQLGEAKQLGEEAEVQSVKEAEAKEMVEVDAARKEEGQLKITPEAAEASSPPISRSLGAREPSVAETATKKSNVERAARITMSVVKEAKIESTIQGKAEALKSEEEGVKLRLRAAMR